VNSNKAIETEIELMEKEILYLTGKKRERARKKSPITPFLWKKLFTR